MTASFVAGMGLGLAIAVPIGPMGLLCIHRTLVMGLRAGVATGCGAATVHVGYIAIIALGLGPAMTTWLDDGAAALSIACALALLWFAAGSLRREVAVVGERSPAARITFVCCYLSAIPLGAINPSTILLVVAVLPTIPRPGDAAAAAWLAGGAFAGSIAWWTTLAALVAQFRGRVSTRVLDWSRRVSAILVAGLAASMLVGAANPRSW